MKKNILLFSLAGALLASCSKSEQSAKEKYVPKLDRTFTWQHTYFTTRGAMSDTTIFYPDTTIAISVISSDDVSFLGTTFTYTSEDYTRSGLYSTNEFLRFVDKSSLGIHSSRTLEYYYKKDSVAVIYYGGGMGGHYQTVYASRH